LIVDIHAGELIVKPSQRFALVVAEFNRFITEKLAEGAVDCLLRHGARDSQITQFLVPGAFEIPLIARELASTGKYAAVICLGCVIRGETDHYDHVAGQVARGVGAVGPDTGVPTIFGVITADTLEQALNRAGLKSGNTGWNAAVSAIGAANILAKIKSHK
jgi:6,7-dimethyl-8-ribityllumazine synthase